MNTLIFKPLYLSINELFNFSFDNFQTGMSNPNSIFNQSIFFENNQKRKKQEKKKNNQIKAGRNAQQDGENVKNDLATKLSYKGNFNDISKQAEILLKHLNLQLSDVAFINTKSYSDGRILCAKSDLKTTVKCKNNNVICQISLKSTFNTTQIAVHSVLSFNGYFKKAGIIIPDEVIEFLTHFSFSNSLYPNKPNFLFNESKRRERFTVEEINAFNPDLFKKAEEFFRKNANFILNFLISVGGETNPANFATTLAFCDKNLNNLTLIEIKKLIAYKLAQSEINNSFFVANKPTKNGTTTISLFDGLIVMQMKGSGSGSAYHNLQFRVNGSKLKKLVTENLI